MGFFNTGGGSSLIHQATVTLNDAQIKALPSGVFQIVDAGTGKIPWPVLVVATLDARGGIYTNIGSVSLFTQFAADTNTAFTTTGEAGSLGAAAVTVFYFVSPGAFKDTTDPDMHILNLLLSNSLGNLTGGNAANSLKVGVSYMIYDIVTAQFE